MHFPTVSQSLKFFFWCITPQLPLSSEFDKMNEGIVMESKESSRSKKASQAALNKDVR